MAKKKIEDKEEVGENVQMSFYLKKDIAKKAKMLSIATEIKLSDILRKAIEEFIKKNEGEL